MLAELTEKTIRTIGDAAKRLTGAARREFKAGVAIDYCQGSPGAGADDDVEGYSPISRSNW